MPHLVVYRSPDGKPSYFQAEDLDGAVRHVEHLRNVEQVVDSRIFRLQEVPIEFRTYYRVELGPIDDEVEDAADSEDAGWDEAAEPTEPEEWVEAPAPERVTAEVVGGPGMSATGASSVEGVDGALRGPTPVTPSHRIGLFTRG